MDIKEIAEELNSLSADHQIGNLQNIRKEIKHLKRLPGRKIFRGSTISDAGWAFHYGGRKELQFNIGFEKEGFRYGIAFSLEPSQSLPDVSILYPKILKLNCIIKEDIDFFNEYKMWYWQSQRSDIMSVSVIHDELIRPHTFIFIGRINRDIDFNAILNTFDELLEVYIKVESDSYNITSNTISDDQRFVFNNSNANLVLNRKYSSKAKETNVTVRHSYLQSIFYQELSKRFGKSNVSLENPWGNNRIDIVVKTDHGYYFYEVKVASSAKTCIRQALGQILEYAFWPGKRHASKIIIAGEHKLDEDGERYLAFLRNDFNLPLEYQRINLA